LSRGRHSAAHYLRISRFSTIFWGAVLATIALFASQWGSVLESGLSIASVTLGILLGVFLLGVLTKRPGENAAIAGVIAGALMMIYIRFGTKIPFTWWVPIGSAATFGGGWLASMILPPVDDTGGSTA
jgi:solute:Na+ symporter, SSS family